jgi:DNA mismatch endonuclease (patch repair protein)
LTDRFSREKRSEIMSRIHQPTRLEERVRRWLEERGVPHEMYPKVEGRPDIRIGDTYVFVDGCFWHCCPQHYRRPKSNEEFWIRHVEEADKRREERRAKLPYRWARIWEHELAPSKIDATMEGVLRSIGYRVKAVGEEENREEL